MSIDAEEHLLLGSCLNTRWKRTTVLLVRSIFVVSELNDH